MRGLVSTSTVDGTVGAGAVTVACCGIVSADSGVRILFRTHRMNNTTIIRKTTPPMTFTYIGTAFLPTELLLETELDGPLMPSGMLELLVPELDGSDMSHFCLYTQHN